MSNCASGPSLNGGGSSLRGVVQYVMKLKFAPEVRALWLEELFQAAAGMYHSWRVDGKECTVTGVDILGYNAVPLGVGVQFEAFESVSTSGKVSGGTASGKVPGSSVKTEGVKDDTESEEELHLGSPVKKNGMTYSNNQENGNGDMEEEEGAPIEPQMMKLQQQLAQMAKAMEALTGMETQTGGANKHKTRTLEVKNREFEALLNKNVQVFVRTNTGVQETHGVHQVRRALWRRIEGGLGHHKMLSNGLIVGDIRGLLSKVVEVRQASSATTAMEITGKIRELVKTDKVSYPRCYL